MTSGTLVLPDGIADQIESAARNHLETAGVVLASIVDSGCSNLRILARELVWVEEAAYARREYNRLSITSAGYVPALGRAEQIGATAIWFHTHPGNDSDPRPSEHDAQVDTEIADLFRLRTASPYYGALIVSPKSDGLSFSGHMDHDTRPPIPIKRLFVSGDRLRLFHSAGEHEHDLSDAFDRNIRAFGPAIQRLLGDLSVGVVGCGGTGSAVAEQLVRLGVRRMLLIDPDDLSISNVTRVYGSTPKDIGKPKVDVISNHLRNIAPEAQIETIQGMITDESVAKRLAQCDVLFGCTDDNAGRLVLSRLTTYLLIPVIDCGVLLTSRQGGNIEGIHGRVTVLVPGQACLVCRNRIDLARASAELLTPEERVRRADEGYAPALGRTEPAVVTFTTSVAAAAVSELLERLIGYGPEPRPGEILLRYHEREISTNIARPRERHYCHPLSGKMGIGITQPYLEQTWPT
jgi:molybdopterin/thiamine biosynthesis adenylyltransferase/proteasome lid subunit RPN8/RPN11